MRSITNAFYNVVRLQSSAVNIFCYFYSLTAESLSIYRFIFTGELAMLTRKRILAISGSTKKNSSNKSILDFISQRYSKLLELDLYQAIDKLPHFNPDLDTENPPTLITELRNKIQSADGVLICTPEYVFSLPGSLKNAIEWQVSTTLFSNKPVALIVAAASGTKAMESLTLIMTTIESRIAKNSTLLIKGVKGKIDDAGQIKDEEVITEIDILVQSFIKSINETNTIPTKYKTD